MKKLITILAITSLFSFQAFALTSEGCNDPSSTCQAFELDADAFVLSDFIVHIAKNLSIGKVRAGESIQVNFDTEGNRGKSYGFIDVLGELVTSYTISCDKNSSSITFVGGASTALQSCVLKNVITDNQGSSLNAEAISYMYNSYHLYIDLNVPSDAQAGEASGVIHIELAYE